LYKVSIETTIPDNSGICVGRMVRLPEPRSDRPATKRVLVVDDHPAVPLALRVAFRLDGRFDVADSAATGAEGLQKLGGQDAVLLDLHLPDMVGSDMVSAFRERGCGVPLILHSAADDTPCVDAVRELVDAVVLKSRVNDVLAALSRLTEA
jgi:DNA-binding NarL/FixJ family response regulator